MRTQKQYPSIIGGYAFSPGSRRDKIVEYYIRRGDYNLFLINEVLFRNGEPLLAKSLT